MTGNSVCHFDLAMIFQAILRRFRNQKSVADEKPIGRQLYEEIMDGPPALTKKADDPVSSWGPPTRKTTGPEILILPRRQPPEIDLHPTDPSFKLAPKDLRLW